jgi:hypothetical protein
MSLSERRTAIARLASLLLEAAGVAMGSVAMTSADLRPAAVLKRKAAAYVWRSTQAQLQTNLESRWRQSAYDPMRRRQFLTRKHR